MTFGICCRGLILAGALFSLGACSIDDAAGKIVEVILDPGIEVGPPETQPSQISLHAFAAEEMNRNFENAPSPIVVKIFALSSDHRLFGYDFFSVVENTDETLGVTLLELMDEQEIAPDTYKIFGPYELPKKTKKLAVVAEYLDIEAAIWRSSIKVSDIGAKDRLLLLLLEEEVRLVKAED